VLLAAAPLRTSKVMPEETSTPLALPPEPTASIAPVSSSVPAGTFEP